MRIGILTGGGDVPGLNACIRSVVLSADALGWQVTGFRRGWEGVMGIDPADPASIAANSLELNRESVRGIDRTGGTVLHTSRRDPRTMAEGDRTGDVLKVLGALRQELGDEVGDNEPYAMDGIDYTIPFHADAHGLEYVELEVRQDLIASAEGEQTIGALLARVLAQAMPV